MVDWESTRSRDQVTKKENDQDILRLIDQIDRSIDWWIKFDGIHKI